MMRRVRIAALLFAAGIPLAQAQAVWHCSRNPASAAPPPDIDTVLTVKIPFELSSSNMVALELSDLYRVYSGIPVRVNGMPLSACFLDGGNQMNATAMGMLGLSPSALSSLARSTSIVSNHVFDVSNEQQMEACIREHHPAVGYLSKAKQTEGITPCF